MKSLLKSTLFLLMFLCFSSAYAQSGAKFMLAGVSAQKSFLDLPAERFTGWEMRLDARLGARAWYFAPSLAYQNTSLLGNDSLNPFSEGPRLHTLKLPMALGLKFKTAPFSRVFAKAGLIGNYVLIIDDNETFNFEEVVDIWASAFFSFGYDLNKFSIDYRFERSLANNFRHVEGVSSFHVVGVGINF